MDTEELYRKALHETIPCAVLIYDRRGRVVFWNRAAERLTGYASEEMLGETCQRLKLRLCHTPDTELLAAFCPVVRGTDTREVEFEVRRKDGSTVPVVRKTQAVLDDAGQPVGAIEAMVDVTLIKQAQGQIRTLRHEIARRGAFDEMVGTSRSMRELFEAVQRVAETDASVVVEGETGTGKEMVARSIHDHSPRREAIFLPVNCGALPDSLVEAELFGHAEGAFTGATSERIGRFQEASGGTLFLDEIGELPLPSQVKLLRVLQTGEVTRLGESVPRRVDTRIVAATNRDLVEQTRAGRFREDLFYRLRVVALRTPPLRERRDDIPDLVAHFLARLNDRHGRSIEGLTPRAMDLLTRYDWPGNVRQLEHALEHACIVTGTHAAILDADAFPPEIGAPPKTSQPHPAPPPVAPQGDARTPADERTALLEALSSAGGNKTRAARALGITRAGLYKKLKRLGIEA
jgi:PAS domain S-box-containing protein